MRERDKFPVVIDSLFWFDREKENNTSETDDSPVREREKDKFLVVIGSLFWFDREKEGANFFFCYWFFAGKLFGFNDFCYFQVFGAFGEMRYFRTKMEKNAPNEEMVEDGY